MEEKKLDVNSIIGFGLIFVILIWVMYNSQQSEAEEKAKQAQKNKLKPKNLKQVQFKKLKPTQRQQ
jgi:YidC/Oxa1 family membrane protein insertase